MNKLVFPAAFVAAFGLLASAHAADVGLGVNASVNLPTKAEAKAAADAKQEEAKASGEQKQEEAKASAEQKKEELGQKATEVKAQATANAGEAKAKVKKKGKKLAAKTGETVNAVTGALPSASAEAKVEAGAKK